MGFKVKKIDFANLETPAGDVVLEGKSGENPTMKLFTDTIADNDDDMTNSGSFIVSGERKRSFIQGVFGFADADLANIQSAIQNSITTGDGIPASFQMTDGTIYSNEVLIVGDVNYSGEGTIELKFVGASDWITS